MWECQISRRVDPKIGASGALQRKADSRDSYVGGKLVRNSKYQSDILN